MLTSQVNSVHICQRKCSRDDESALIDTFICFQHLRTIFGISTFNLIILYLSTLQLKEIERLHIKVTNFNEIFEFQLNNLF